jgi:hypothetical protein
VEEKHVRAAQRPLEGLRPLRVAFDDLDLRREARVPWRARDDADFVTLELGDEETADQAGRPGEHDHDETPSPGLRWYLKFR